MTGVRVRRYAAQAGVLMAMHRQPGPRGLDPRDRFLLGGALLEFLRDQREEFAGGVGPDEFHTPGKGGPEPEELGGGNERPPPERAEDRRRAAPGLRLSAGHHAAAPCIRAVRRERLRWALAGRLSTG
ncbi:hypothetical protein NicSoilB8_09830 [Arthrobacter sp. NicSoilB8]|nr:hypothetical protein NicSoilB8_09830 [Arthrobacter sp. NicSoilB8]